MILQVGHEIERENPRFKSLDDIDKVKFEKIFKEKIDVFADFYANSLELTPAKKSIFLEPFRTLKINNVWDLFKVTFLKVKVLFKRKGFGVAIAVMMGMTSDYVVPGILINMGLPHLIPISAMTPWSVMYSTIPGSLEKLVIKRKIISALGSKEAYLKYQDNLGIIQKELRLKNPDNFLYPMRQVDDMSEVIVVAKNTWVKSMMGKMGFFQDSVSYQSMLRFMVGNGITNDYVQYVMTLKTEKQVKTTLLIQHILNSDDENLKLSFRKKFSKQIFLTKNRDQWSGLMDWTKKMMSVQTVEDLRKMLNQVPENLDSREIVALWEHMILPRYAEEFDMNYFEYRRLVRNFDSMKAILSEQSDKSFKESGKDLFFDYFRRSFSGIKLGGCNQSHDQVLKLLMRTL
ncbi:MAG: hypothetical protein KC493_04015 [Bacteriovoracaceae bacterium]|nr:hypothetical protein [Bacteriovoracaceae bacterium]